MGCRRAGFYSLDLLDNGGARSAREIHPELQALEVGDVLAATPKGDDGFEVLAIEPERVLVLGILVDAATGAQLPFAAPRPARFWHVTWVFLLEPRGDGGTTRLVTRGRVAHDRTQRLHARWVRPVHRVMQTVQLRNVAARAEGRLRRDDWRDVVDGLVGAAGMAVGLLTPFRRATRSTWGAGLVTASRTFPGDELVPDPTWGWTHAVEVDVPAEEVWPWVAQIGADRGGFYSYQWLENLVGCGVRNAETIHPQWQIGPGGSVSLHPGVPPLPVVDLEPGHHVVVRGVPEIDGAGSRPDRWVDASWLFLVEPLDPESCRVVSRYRCATSPDLVTRLQFGPGLVEPIGSAMDRRMLRGIRHRAERRRWTRPGLRRIDA